MSVSFLLRQSYRISWREQRDGLVLDHPVLGNVVFSLS